MTNGIILHGKELPDCPLEKSDREIMHEAIDKICDAQEKPHADDVDTSRVIYREATSDGKIREIFVHAFSIIKEPKK